MSTAHLVGTIDGLVETYDGLYYGHIIDGTFANPVNPILDVSVGGDTTRMYKTHPLGSFTSYRTVTQHTWNSYFVVASKLSDEHIDIKLNCYHRALRHNENLGSAMIPVSDIRRDHAAHEFVLSLGDHKVKMVVCFEAEDDQKYEEYGHDAKAQLAGRRHVQHKADGQVINGDASSDDDDTPPADAKQLSNSPDAKQAVFLANPSTQAVYNPEKMGKCDLFQNKSGSLVVGLNACEPGQSHRLHEHTNMDKVYYVLEGEGTFLLDGKSQRCSKGQMLFAPAGVAHGILNDSSARLLLLTTMNFHPKSSRQSHHH
jgi:quercetin dioxygenase-like cupin family protein